VRVAPRPRGFAARLKVAEAGESNRLATGDGALDELEEGIDQILGLALFESETHVHQLGAFGLGERRGLDREEPFVHDACCLILDDENRTPCDLMIDRVENTNNGRIDMFYPLLSSRTMHHQGSRPQAGAGCHC
jgi:hypothetical protein